MAKKDQNFRKYSAEFKIHVIMDMREHRLGYRETARKYDLTVKSEASAANMVQRWERIYKDMKLPEIIDKPLFKRYMYSYKITDDKFDGKNYFETLYRSVFRTNEYIYYLDGLGDAPMPLFTTDGSVLYSTKPFTEYATLFDRYIDIDSIRLEDNGTIERRVIARGSSQFREGKVQEPDSTVIMSISYDTDMEYGYKHLVLYSKALRDHIELDDISELDKIDAMVFIKEKFEKINELMDVDKSKIYLLDNDMMASLGSDENHYYRVENDTFRSIVDVYDWFSILFVHTYGMSVFKEYYVTGLTDTRGNVVLPILFENEFGLFISTKVFEEKTQLESIDFQDVSLYNVNDCFSELSWGCSLLNNIRPFLY